MASNFPERRTAMYHAHLAMGAVMADAEGWQLPRNYGDACQEAKRLRETVGVSDISPIGKVRVVGEDAASAIARLSPQADGLTMGAVSDTDSPLEGVGKLLSMRLARDEILILTRTGGAQAAIAAMTSDDRKLFYAVDVTSGLSGVAMAGPATPGLLSRITEVDTSPRSLPNLTCVQSRFADIPGLLLRRDVDGLTIFQLYVGREFGEYLWETLLEAAAEVSGGPVGTDALLGLRG